MKNEKRYWMLMLLLIVALGFNLLDFNRIQVDQKVESSHPAIEVNEQETPTLMVDSN